MSLYLKKKISNSKSYNSASNGMKWGWERRCIRKWLWNRVFPLRLPDQRDGGETESRTKVCKSALDSLCSIYICSTCAPARTTAQEPSREKPKLILLCDSTSLRSYALIFLPSWGSAIRLTNPAESAGASSLLFLSHFAVPFTPCVLLPPPLSLSLSLPLSLLCLKIMMSIALIPRDVALFSKKKEESNSWSNGN